MSKDAQPDAAPKTPSQVERRFLPTMPRERAAELMGQRERAVRQTVAA